MSERGSFVTEYIYCNDCLAAAEAVLCLREKYLCGTRVPGWIGDGLGSNRLPIVAGKIGGLYPGEERHSFEQEYIPALERVICHPMRIAVIPEAGHGERFFLAKPSRVKLDQDERETLDE